ncbi:hypothetical protein BGX26_002440, partial [Mortierella sp. AD094]
MGVSIFNYPELCHVLATHLSQGDIAACLLVNKQLHTNFFPFLYKSITILDYAEYITDPAVEFSAHRQGPLQGLFESQTETSASKVQQHGPVPKHSPFLSSLQNFGHMVESLTFCFRENLEFCQKTSLIKDHNPKTYPGLEQADIYVKILETCPLYRLKSLEIRGLHREDISRPLLFECGPSSVRQKQIKLLQQVRDQHARDLSVARIIKAAAVAATVKATIDSGATIETTHESKGIHRLVVSDPNSFGKHSLQAIADTSLSTTLEELDVQRCGCFRSEEMHFALSILPNLKVADFRCRDETSIPSTYSGILPKRLSNEEEL